MPNYEYVCESCGAQQLVQHSMSATPEILCADEVHSREGVPVVMKKQLGTFMRVDGNYTPHFGK